MDEDSIVQQLNYATASENNALTEGSNALEEVQGSASE